jgi:hypothetical protein
MRQRTRDAERFLGRKEGLAAETAAHQFDDPLGQVGKVAERLVSDAFPFAVGPPEQVRGVRLAPVVACDSGYVNSTVSGSHADTIRLQRSMSMEAFDNSLARFIR